ncbi:MAG: T9SS type A sorting domain-containing protein [Bacteroidota bacterium]
MKSVFYLFAFMLAGPLSAQPVEFEPAPCFPAAPGFTYRAFVDMIGDAGNEEAATTADWVAAIDAEGYVVGRAQLELIAGFGCPQGTAFNMSVAPQNPSGIPAQCPAAPYGMLTGETFDLVIWDASRGSFYTVVSQVTFMAGTTGGISTGNCVTVNFDAPYVVPANPLPVVMANLNVRLNRSREAVISWQTLAEQGSSHFEIERSATGSEWTVIGRINAAGDSNDELAYELYDFSPLGGINLYRIKSVDLDGSYYYSPVVSLDLKSQDVPTGFAIFPNPAIDQTISISFDGQWSENNSVNIRLYDINGRQLALWDGVEVISQTLSLPNLPAGMYQLVVAGGQEQLIQRLVIR